MVFFVALNLAVEKHQDGGTVLFDHLEFHAQDFTNRLEPGKILLEVVHPFRLQNVPEVAADNLIATVAECVQESLVDIQEIALLVQRLIGHGRIDEHLPEAGLILPEFILHPFPRRDIGKHGERSSILPFSS